MPAFSLRQEVTNVDLAAPAATRADGLRSRSSARPPRLRDRGRPRPDRRSRPGRNRARAGDGVGHPARGRTRYRRGLGAERVVGFAESPDNVSYPLAVPRVYMSRRRSRTRSADLLDRRVNLAEIWLRDPRNLDEVLVQARASSYGLHGLRFITRSGVRVLLDQAAGIVIDLLVALSLIALATAGGDARRLGARRGPASSRRHRPAPRRRRLPGPLASTQALEALLVAAPAATIGDGRGRARHLRPEQPPADDAQRAAGRRSRCRAAGGGLAGRPARSRCSRRRGRRGAPQGDRRWRCCAGPSSVDRSPDAAGPRRARGRRRGPRPARARRLRGRTRRARLAATATALGSSTAFVLLMLALASALTALETDPGALGKRYQLTASCPPPASPACGRSPASRPPRRATRSRRSTRSRSARRST